MRSFMALAVFGLFLSGPASSEILYARPDADAAGASYRWGHEILVDTIPFGSAIQIAKEADGSRAIEIRLLHQVDAQETLYSVDLGTLQSALRWKGSENKKLVIRGQIDRSESVPQALTTLVGRPLRQTLCEPQGIDLCGPSPQQSPTDSKEGRQDLADHLAEEMGRPNAVKSERPASHDVRFRLHCFLLWESAFVEFVDMGFRDCWLAAVASYASSNIALRDSVINGSTWAFLAVGKKGAPETAHSFDVTGNYWRQSPSTYRSGTDPCDFRNDWACPVSVWSDVPWAVVHHHFWSPLNGALFMAKDILGNVRIAKNHLSDAYNGVRAKLSNVCLADPRCRERANAGFEIVGNTFEKIRDNPIEPEGRAAFWIVKQNTFLNVYAGISTDGVSGHDLLIFGNVFSLDNVPGLRCHDEGWLGSRQFQLTRGGGKWSTDSAEGDDARCSSHLSGTVIKLGSVADADPDTPMLERIIFFNNSLRTRSPLFRGSPAPPIISYNNAVRFIGCGRLGAAACRQEPASDPSCHGKDVWTRDREALYAECFPIADSNGHPAPHLMRFNAYNRAPEHAVDEIDRDRVDATSAFVGGIAPEAADPTLVGKAFAIDNESPLAKGGCTVLYANGDLKCVAAAGPVGAMLPNGERFDLDIPFRFPFADVLRHVNVGTPLRQ